MMITKLVTFQCLTCAHVHDQKHVEMTVNDDNVSVFDDVRQRGAQSHGEVHEQLGAGGGPLPVPGGNAASHTKLRQRHLQRGH